MSSGARTAEEAKADNINAMGRPVGEQYSALWQELVWLYAVWGEYVDLYGTNVSRVELMNRAAGHFFRIVQDAVWEQILLHIARLTDPARSAGKPNLSVQSLLAIVDDPAPKGAAEAKVKAAIEAAAFCRDWRNRRIAHRDLDLVLKNPTQPLARASLLQVRNALDRIADVLNTLSQHYLHSETYFEGASVQSGTSLLHLLRSALVERDKRWARIKRGEIHPLDFKQDPL